MWQTVLDLSGPIAFFSMVCMLYFNVGIHVGKGRGRAEIYKELMKLADYRWDVFNDGRVYLKPPEGSEMPSLFPTERERKRLMKLLKKGD